MIFPFFKNRHARCFNYILFKKQVVSHEKKLDSEYLENKKCCQLIDSDSAINPLDRKMITSQFLNDIKQLPLEAQRQKY